MNISNSTPFFSGHARSAPRMDPVRDWLILLLVGVTILAGIIGWNVWTFDTVASGGTLGKVATSTVAVFNRSALDTVHTIFLDRAAEETKYVSGEYTYTDPAPEVLKKKTPAGTLSPSL